MRLAVTTLSLSFRVVTNWNFSLKILFKVLWARYDSVYNWHPCTNCIDSRYSLCKVLSVIFEFDIWWPEFAIPDCNEGIRLMSVCSLVLHSLELKIANSNQALNNIDQIRAQMTVLHPNHISNRCGLCDVMKEFKSDSSEVEMWRNRWMGRFGPRLLPAIPTNRYDQFHCIPKSLAVKILYRAKGECAEMSTLLKITNIKGFMSLYISFLSSLGVFVYLYWSYFSLCRLSSSSISNTRVIIITKIATLFHINWIRSERCLHCLTLLASAIVFLVSSSGV